MEKKDYRRLNNAHERHKRLEVRILRRGIISIANPQLSIHSFSASGRRTAGGRTAADGHSCGVRRASGRHTPGTDEVGG